ncbi:MAG: CapA family protein [Saccharofermentanales bacterium]
MMKRTNTAITHRKAAKRKKRRKSDAVLIAVFIISISMAGAIFFSGSYFQALIQNKNFMIPTPTLRPTITVAATPVENHQPDLSAKAVLTSVGDILLHSSVISGGLQKDGTYDFNYAFGYVSGYFKQSDYAIANFEGTLDGPPYTGYPGFCAPDTIAAAIKNAGIGMVTTANNHAYDRRLSGLKRTYEVFSNEGVAVVGTRSAAADPSFRIVSINGIRIGFTGYTYETVGQPAGKALNGIALAPEAESLIDSFNYYRKETFDKNLQEMADRISQMKKAGAECIIFEIHWGSEYKNVSNAKQKELAQFLSDHGADVIFGHHPHVLQEIDVLESAAGGRKTLVYYSLGNFLSNMLYTSQGTNGYAEDAMIARVEIVRSESGAINVTKGEYISTYVYKDKTTGKTIHKIIPVEEALKSPEKFELPQNVISSLIQDSSIRIKKVLSGSDGMKKGIIVGEFVK